MTLDYNSLIDECTFTTARSGGKGGQNVNKVESKVTLMFDISSSNTLSDDDKNILFDKLKNRINKQGVLQLSEETDRSQLKNKKTVINRFVVMIKESLKTEKPRKPTKPTRASILKRIDNKKKHSDKKRLRSGRNIY